MKKISMAVGVLVVLALLLAYFAGPGRDAESSPEASIEDEIMTTQEAVIPPIDANRPAVIETAAFAMG